jgi:hypothetical protein
MTNRFLPSLGEDRRGLIPLYIRGRPGMQSLIHQGTYSNKHLLIQSVRYLLSRNPFYIRGPIPSCSQSEYERIFRERSRNPLYIRGPIPTLRESLGISQGRSGRNPLYIRGRPGCAIPFTSGDLFQLFIVR